VTRQNNRATVKSANPRHTGASFGLGANHTPTSRHRHDATAARSSGKASGNRTPYPTRENRAPKAVEALLPQFGLDIENDWADAGDPTPPEYNGDTSIFDRPDLPESHWAALVLAFGYVHRFEDVALAVAINRAWLARARAAGWTAHDAAVALQREASEG